MRRLLTVAVIAAIGVAGGTGAAVASSAQHRQVVVSPAPPDLASSPPSWVDTTQAVACYGNTPAPLTVRFVGNLWDVQLTDAPVSYVETFVGYVVYRYHGKRVQFTADYESHLFSVGSPDSNSVTVVGSGPEPAGYGLNPYAQPGTKFVDGEAVVTNRSDTESGQVTNVCAVFGIG
jgi:hypothetical protein